MPFLVFFIFFTPSLFAAESDKPLWEYGVGAGYVRYPHYPGSDQHEDIFLPFPTFQYRGRILRADDQEGGRAYLLKDEKWSFEFSGGGSLPIASSKNRARQGMEDLPLVVEFGPQLVFTPNRSWEFKWALFPSITADGFFVRDNGVTSVVRGQYQWEKEAGRFRGQPLILNGEVSVDAKAASQEFHQTYFGVGPKDVTASRPLYHPEAGFLSAGISYFQRFTVDKASVYAAIAYTDYSNSVNRGSPLHTADSTTTYALAFTYTLGESKRRAVPVEETEGLINRVQQRGSLRLMPFQ